MNFRITGLNAAPFRQYFGMSEPELATHGVRRYTALTKPGFPDRIELRDAEPGETVLLLNYTHQPAATPYRASHAIYVLEGAGEPYDRVNEIPDALRVRTLSLRAFDQDHMMIDAAIVEGSALEAEIENLLRDERAAYLHAHYAKRGCYAARIEPVGRVGS
jgi:hypothetical protein